MPPTDYSRPLTLISLDVDATHDGIRLDRVLIERLPHRSRSFFQMRIEGGRIRVNGQRVRASWKVKKGDRIDIDVEVNAHWVDPHSIPLDVIHEDAGLVAVNKQPWILVHPTGGVQGGTLLNALHARHRSRGGDDATLPSVVHRLDAETSGVLVMAKGPEAARHYGQSFENRHTVKVYLALLEGKVSAFSSKEPLGDDPHSEIRVRQGVLPEDRGGKPAHSDFLPLASDGAMTLCAVRIHTGRLHQIRVHAQHAGHPVVGDPLYNPRDLDERRWIEGAEPAEPQPGRPRRHMLHAHLLSLPSLDGKELRITAPATTDFLAFARDLFESWASSGKTLEWGHR
ncbi:MAG: RluA family pseudouridine synthase [Planctomycetota bacterium]